MSNSPVEWDSSRFSTCQSHHQSRTISHGTMTQSYTYRKSHFVDFHIFPCLSSVNSCLCISFYWRVQEIHVYAFPFFGEFRKFMFTHFPFLESYELVLDLHFQIFPLYCKGMEIWPFSPVTAYRLLQWVGTFKHQIPPITVDFSQVSPILIINGQ